jgi:diacylglycerol kinase (ATP)
VSERGVDERPERRLRRDDRRWPGAPSLVRSFNFAFEGIIWSLRTQRNMRLHFGAGVAALILALGLDVTRTELVALILCIGAVLATEMLNSAIEAAIDIAKPTYDPLAKVAKDAAAGAVLIASVMAVAVGYLVFIERLASPSSRTLDGLVGGPVDVTAILLALTIAAVIALKARSGTGTALYGGWPSGHAAIAFAAWASITFVTADFRHHLLVSSLAFLMALLVVQTRVEAGAHTVREVVAGGLLGSLLALLLFQFTG